MIVEPNAGDVGPIAPVRATRRPADAAPPDSVGAMTAAAAHPKYLYLDALRGWAILMVMLIHVGVQLTVPGPGGGGDSLVSLPPWLAKICVYSRHGVQLFFVVSALSLTLSALSRRSIDIRAFALRRFLRIAPMFYLAILFYLVRDGWGPREWAPYGIDGLDVAATFGFLNVWRDSAINSVVPGDWSIGAEMNFYVLLPFVLWVGRRSFKALLAFVAIAFAAGLGFERLHHVPAGFADDLAIVFPAQLPVFLVGVVTAFVIVEAPARRLNGGLGAVLLAFIVLALPQTPLAGNLALFAVLCCFLAYALHNAPTSPIVNRAIARVGTVSFSMYLIHFALLAPISRLCLASASNRGAAMLALVYALVAAATFVCASATHAWVEAPFIRLGARLTAQWSASAARRRAGAQADVAAGVGAAAARIA